MVGEVVGTGAAGLLMGGILSKEIVAKLLGPTADYLGGNLKDFTQKRWDNVGKIFQNAVSKSAELDESRPVPPKVLRDIINEGSFSDDTISIEYFGGVLASSKTGISRDDRASTITSCLSRLSAYQIRAHYVIYSCIRSVFLSQDININDNPGRNQAKLFMPFHVFGEGLSFTKEEAAQFGGILTHCLFGLSREDLIDQNFFFGLKNHLLQQGMQDPDEAGGLLVAPSVLGAEMFLRAHGASETDANNLISTKVELRPLSEVVIQPGSRALNALPSQP